MVRRFVVSLALLSACTPPPSLPPVQPAGVASGFERTWNAVIDVLSEDNIPVKTLDKASGYVMAELSDVDSDTMNKFADCGSQLTKFLVGVSGVARYNIVVRGDSTTSTVKVTAKFISRDDCKSRNVFENEFQDAVKARAEAR
jgi:hypothetical protein